MLEITKCNYSVQILAFRPTPALLWSQAQAATTRVRCPKCAKQIEWPASTKLVKCGHCMTTLKFDAASSPSCAPRPPEIISATPKSQPLASLLDCQPRDKPAELKMRIAVEHGKLHAHKLGAMQIYATPQARFSTL